MAMISFDMDLLCIHFHGHDHYFHIYILHGFTVYLIWQPFFSSHLSMGMPALGREYYYLSFVVGYVLRLNFGDLHPFLLLLYLNGCCYLRCSQLLGTCQDHFQPTSDCKLALTSRGGSLIKIYQLAAHCH
jgi:hypothetical protein